MHLLFNIITEKTCVYASILIVYGIIVVFCGLPGPHARKKYSARISLGFKMDSLTRGDEHACAHIQRNKGCVCKSKVAHKIIMASCFTALF